MLNSIKLMPQIISYKLLLTPRTLTTMLKPLLKQNKRSIGDGIKMILERRAAPTGLIF